MGKSFRGLQEEGIEYGSRKLYSGKVRDVLDLGDSLLLVTSDRISAFDRVLGTIPHKGEILNRLAVFWLQATGGDVPNHLIQTIGTRSVLVRKAQVVPIEVIVRNYLTGSAWRDYQAGREISGHRLPAGLRKNQEFAAPILTPSTKAAVGDHDEPISEAQILSRGIATEELWSRISTAALKLFGIGRRMAAERGLILVDTKYEFGIDPSGELLVVDEIHTPDSSRFWYADSYQEAFESGSDPRALDKEFLRSWLLDQGFSGEGPAPALPPELVEQVSSRYAELWKLLTGSEFRSLSDGIEAEKRELQVFLS